MYLTLTLTRFLFMFLRSLITIATTWQQSVVLHNGQANLVSE
jgi:hypothetical protein